MFLRIALGFYVLATALGLLLRADFLWKVPRLVFGFAVHAHSHTLYFGWAGLAVCALWFHQSRPATRAERALLWGLVAISLATFPAFLTSGYGRPGIIVSALAVLVWPALVFLLWRRAREADLAPAARAYLRAAIGYLAFALCGAWGRVVVLIVKPQDPSWGLLTVFAFVHTFAWFVLFATFGLLRQRQAALGLTFDDARLSTQRRWMVAFAWLTFPLGVPGVQDGVLGSVARLAAAGSAVGALLWARALLQATSRAEDPGRALFRWAALWAAVLGALELGAAAGFAAQGAIFRHPVILYLHVLLVGVGSLPLLWLCGGATTAPRVWPALYNGGLAVMCAGLGLASLPGLFGAPAALGRAGVLVAFVGAAALFGAGAAVLFGVLRGRAARTSAAT